MPISREVEITETVVLLGRLMPAAPGRMEAQLRSHRSDTLIASWGTTSWASPARLHRMTHDFRGATWR